MVKFGQKLKTNKVRGWEKHYIDYSALKQKIKRATKNNEPANSAVNLPLLDNDDFEPNDNFIIFLREEIQKADRFFKARLYEFELQLEHFAETLDSPALLERAHVASDHELSINADSDSEGGLPPIFSAPLVPVSTKEKVASHERGLAKRRHAWIELARQMRMLQNFAALNYTAVKKIVKKYIKNTRRQISTEEEMESIEFADSSRLEKLLEKVTKQFAKEYCDGDERMAAGSLMEKQGIDVDWRQYQKGVLLGVCMMLSVWFLWDVVVDEAVHSTKTYLWEQPLFRVFRAVFAFILLQWCWGILTFVWLRARVNYIYLFDLNPSTTPWPHETFASASLHTSIFFIVLLLWHKVLRHDFPQWIPAEVYPAALFGIFLLRLVLPPKRQLKALIPVLQVLVSPFGRVTFLTACIGDLLTSMVKPMYDVAFTLCALGTGTFFSTDEEQRALCEQSHTMLFIVKPIISALPLWLRMHQNLRRYYETKNRHPSLSNAFKYAFAHSIVLFGVFNPTLLRFDSGKADLNSVLFVGFFVCSTLYTFTWDVTMDWSIGRPKHAFLRKDRMFMSKSVYYLAIVADFILRFLWTLTLVPFARIELFVDLSLVEISENLLGPIEIMRRTMWAIFRVENEHLHSTEGYRKNDFVPLVFETALPTSVQHHESKKRGWVLLLEGLVFIIVVVLLAVIAILDRQG